jgi:hypothetical protein
MIAVRLISQEEVNERLTAAGFKDTGKRFSGDTGEYTIWITEWGEPIMVPQEGPDKVCAEWVLAERMQKVLATKPKKK